MGGKSKREFIDSKKSVYERQLDSHINKMNRYGQLDKADEDGSEDSEMELYNQKLKADRRIETLFKGINSKNRDKI